MKDWLYAVLRSITLRHALLMWMAFILAGGLDYAVNILAGRWLPPVQFGIFVSVGALLQLLAYLSMTIRNVVAYYTASLSAKDDSFVQVGAFLRGGLRWAGQWGLAGTILMLLASPFLARLLQFPNPWPLWAAAPAVLPFLVRPVTDGAFQGLQRFSRLGWVQLSQSVLRLLLAAVLIWIGCQAVGAIAALPLACFAVLAFVLWLLRPYWQVRSGATAPPVSRHYSSYTLMGLVAFALLVNLDALFVKHFFPPRIAGDYGTVVTLAKISLFAPLTMGIVLLPKAARQRAQGRDSKPVLFLALAGALAPGLFLTVLYFLFPGWLVRSMFTRAYANPGIVLGLASLAASLYAGLNIWLNYALSQEQPAFVYALVGVLCWQGAGMYLFARDSLVHLTLVMVSAGVMGNLAGVMTHWYTVASTRTIGAKAVGS
jgi:O-antigen/teichoic acid export membrane protein